MASQMRVLHLSPHPDDELLGSPAVLIALADAGHEVVNLAVSLGRPADHARREAEVKEACGRAGFRLRICSPSYALARDDDLDAAEARLTDELLSVGRDGHNELRVAPSPTDAPHGH